MKLVSQLNTLPLFLALSLVCGLTISQASAEPMHTPTKMPMAKAESVGMSTERLSRIDDVMQEHIDAGTIQGAVTAVARRGKVVHFSTHGEMDIEKGRAMETDAIFIMASSAKTVIGLATMMLIDEGLISPSDPISKFIPEFADQKVAASAKSKDREGSKDWGQDKVSKEGWDKANATSKESKPKTVPANTPVTIHHLLTHTSGLTGGGIQRAADDTLATYVPKLAQAPLIFQPGTQWVYGNVGIHAVLPRIIEIVTETSFYDFMRKRVFNPLEMNNSYFYLPSDMASKRVVLPDYDVSKKGGGGLLSAAEDYLHFEQMLLNGGELFGHRLLSSEGVDLMIHDHVGDLFSNSGKGAKAQKGMGFGYTVAITLDPELAGNNRGKGAFGWGGAAGTASWTDPANELVAVIMLQQPRGSMQRDFTKAIQEAIIE